jgi:hypothetical protein
MGFATKRPVACIMVPTVVAAGTGASIWIVNWFAGKPPLKLRLCQVIE